MCAIDHLSLQLSFEIFDGEVAIPSVDRWNFPKQDREIVRLDAQQKPILEMAKWSLEPSWLKTPNKVTSYNARAESLVEGKPLFRDAFLRKRCLLFATSFIEHSDRRPGNCPIEVIPFGGALFAYAGLSETSENRRSCSMVTCKPNELIGKYHSRMPVILDAADWRTWLDPQAKIPDLIALLTPFESDGITIRDAPNPGKPPKPTSQSLF